MNRIVDVKISGTNITQSMRNKARYQAPIPTDEAEIDGRICI